jgi:3-methyladenine DNA glycosylase AlkD
MTEASQSWTAEAFLSRLEAERSEAERAKLLRYFKTGAGEYGENDVFIGVRMGTVFALAAEFVAMAPDEIERLLESSIHEARAGALSIMAKQFALKTTGEARRSELFSLYLRRHDRIDSWDLVDLAAHQVVGRHLRDKPRTQLDRLAHSDNPWERRTAIIATLHFLRNGELDDMYRIAGLLCQDRHELVQKAVGGLLRESGKHDRPRLLAFLDDNAATLPRTLLRYAIEHLDDGQRRDYRGRKAGAARA